MARRDPRREGQHQDAGAEVEANLTAADRARRDQLQQQLTAAFARGEPPTGPIVRALIDELGAITARGMPRTGPKVAPARVTALTPLECAQGIAIVRSLRPA